jgi:hypothetical protein
VGTFHDYLAKREGLLPDPKALFRLFKPFQAPLPPKSIINPFRAKGAKQRAGGAMKGVGREGAQKSL